jgi:hypothetical protein
VETPDAAFISKLDIWDFNTTQAPESLLSRHKRVCARRRIGKGRIDLF